jgi:plastocyanin
MRASFLGLAAGGGLILAAASCFSERVGSNTPIDPAAGSCNIPLSVIDSGHVVVAIRDFQFVPDSVVVPAGGTVTWINCETPPQEPHTTTSDSSGVWASADLNPGDRFSHTFDDTGLFPYHCAPHPFMQAKVVVQ